MSTPAPRLDLLDRADALAAPDGDGTVPILRRTVTLDRSPARIERAGWLLTAHGLYDARVDGKPITSSVLDPGWTVYESRLAVQRHDVTALLRGSAATVGLEITLGRGWWCGDLGFGDVRCNYGERPAVLGALHVLFDDGHEQVVPTDASWQAVDSEITDATLYDGQHEDRRRGAGTPRPVEIVEMDRAALGEQIGPPTVRHEARRPERIWTSPSGRTLVDFGQNLVGWIRLRVVGPRGTEIVLRHAEVLEDGELGTRPLRTAAATDRLVLVGDPDGEEFEPTFTVHGFRYAEVTGWPGELSADDLEAVVVHAALPETGSMTCSHDGVNRLLENVRWSQRGNFLAVPTDCPQRDERLGWTGDIAAFAATATFGYDVADFLHDWLLDLRAETELPPVSFVPFVVPDVLKHRADGSYPFREGEVCEIPTAIWGDAAVWVPEALWHAYGDLDRLRAHYPGMVLHLESVERALSPSGLWDQGFQFGDWLDPDAPPEDAAAAKADPGVVATACLVRSARFAAQTARLLGEEAEAERWQALADRTLAAFRRAYVTAETGVISSDCATVYALAIAFDLLDDVTRELSADRLVEHVRAAGYRVSTGFAGTPFVTWALSETGHVEDAYRLLLEEGCPSWLYPVSMGATTIWERWDSMLPDGSINPGEMTSFNHYALGAVADWIYQVVLGLRPAAPGYADVRIAPTPGPGIDWARGSLDSRAGRIEVSWSTEGGGFTLEATVPEGIRAYVDLPSGESFEVTGTGRSEKLA